MSSRPWLLLPWRWIAVFALALAVLGAPASGAGRPAEPPPPAAHPVVCPQFGVNLSGGEFGSNLPGVYGVDYLYPGIDANGYNNAWELDYFHSKGINLIRLNLQWERLQHTLNGPLTTFDLGLIDQVLTNAAARGMSVILGPHNFARRAIGGTDYVIGSPQVPYAAFTDFWQRMAAHFAGHAGLYGYSLDNEPHDTGGLWVTGGAQAGINGIRMADLTAPILVPGDGWSGAWSWLANGNDALRTLNDPSHNLIFDAHQYFDDDSSGTYALSYDAQGAYPTLGVDRLQQFVTWLHTYSLRGMVTEYGVPDDDSRWLTLLDNALAYLQQNSDVILGGADWSAGPWWGVYRLSVEPTGTWPNVTDRPQMSILAARANCALVCTISFTDVDVTNPFYTFIRCLACRNIVSGYSDGTFRWGNNVTRGQLAKILANAAGFSDAIPSTQQTFEDVPPSDAFWLYIERLVGHGAIAGYGCGGAGEPCVPPGNRPYFRAGASATRGQIAKIAALAAAITDPIPSGQQTFEDVPTSNTFWLWIEQLAGRSVISGYACGGGGEPCVPPGNRPYFRWGANTTRGQLAKIAAQTFYPNCTTPARR